MIREFPDGTILTGGILYKNQKEFEEMTDEDDRKRCMRIKFDMKHKNNQNYDQQNKQKTVA